MSSKLGVHINAVTEHAAMLNTLQQARPGWGLIIDHGQAAGFLREARGASPSTRWVGRVWTPTQPLDDPLRRAQEEFDRLMDSSLRDLVDAFQGYNEIAGYPYLPNAGSENVLNYLTFEDRLADLLNAAGRRYVCGAWSVSNPDLKWFTHPLMRQVVGKSYALALHEYCAPTMYYPASFDPTYTDPETYLVTGNFCLRYRKAVRALYPIQPRVLILECGIDSLAHEAARWGVCTPDPGRHYGWRHFCTPTEYLEQLAWYDRQLQQDPYVLGACVYCYGTEDPTWDSFDIRGDMAALLARHAILSQTAPTRKEVEAWLGEEMQKHLIPYYTGAAFDQYRKGVGGTPQGWEARSREVDLEFRPGWRFRAQVYVSSEATGAVQHVVFARISDTFQPLTFEGKPTDWLTATSHFDRRNA